MHAELMRMTEEQVMDEDYAVLKTTRPAKQAASPAEELLVETDVTLAQVRKITLEYAEQASAPSIWLRWQPCATRTSGSSPARTPQRPERLGAQNVPFAVARHTDKNSSQAAM